MAARFLSIQRLTPRRLCLRGLYSRVAMHRILTALLAVGASIAAQAQAPAAFDVASVKPSAPNQNESSMRGNLGSGPTLRLSNQALRDIIGWAYDIGSPSVAGDPAAYRLVGGRDALLSRLFDIDARTSPDATIEQKKAMLRTLLAERFKLRIRARRARCRSTR